MKEGGREGESVREEERERDGGREGGREGGGMGYSGLGQRLCDGVGAGWKGWQWGTNRGDGRLILNKSWNLEMGGGQRSALGLDESGRCKGVGRGWTGGDPELALIRSGEVI